MKKLFLLIIGLMISVAAFAIDLKEAEIALSKNQYWKANEIATMYLGDNPSSARAHMIRSYAMAAQGSYNVAETEFKKAISLDKNGSVGTSPLARKIIGLVSTERAERLRSYVNGPRRVPDQQQVAPAPRREPETVAPTREFSAPESEQVYKAPVQEKLAHSTPTHEPAEHVKPVKVTTLESPEDEQPSRFSKYVTALIIMGMFGGLAYYVLFKREKKTTEGPKAGEPISSMHTGEQRGSNTRRMENFDARRSGPVAVGGSMSRHSDFRPIFANEDRPHVPPSSGMSNVTAGVIGLAAGGALGAMMANAHASSNEKNDSGLFFSGNDSPPKHEPEPLSPVSEFSSEDTTPTSFFSGDDWAPVNEEAASFFSGAEDRSEPVRESYRTPAPEYEAPRSYEPSYSPPSVSDTSSDYSSGSGD